MEKIYIWLFKNLILDWKDLYMLVQKINTGWERFIHACIEKFNIWWKRFIYMLVQKFNIGWEGTIYACSKI